jgi:Porin subfamily
MDRMTTHGAVLRAIMAAAAFAPTALDASAALAQTLTQPSPVTKSPPPDMAKSGTAKSARAERAKTCSIYGPGFVNVPGSDACIKIGGYVSTEVGR